MRKVLFNTLLFLVLLSAVGVARAQMSLSTAVDLAQRNSPKVLMAEADLAHARAVLGASKDAFIPSIAAQGGYGRSTGAPLGVPVIFSLSAQSLIFNFQQLGYIRSAEAAVQATQHALAEARVEVAEDTTNTYLALDNALRRRTALQQAGGYADRLVAVEQERLDAGVDSRMDVDKAKITGVQLRLQILNLRDEIATDTQHLASLTGTGAKTLVTDSTSIPAFAPMPQTDAATQTFAMSEGIAAAYAIAKSKQMSARAEHRYLFLPQLTLQANFSRVDAGLSSYLAYYPRFNGPVGGPENSNNALGFGATITLPIMDFAHRSHHRETVADAAHALADAHQQENAFLEGRAKLANSVQELDARSELARLNQQLAQDQLDAIRVQLQPAAGTVGGTPATPKDEINAELQERLKYLDVLNVELQLQQTRINLLRQQGQLSDFIHRSLNSAPISSTPLPTVPGPALPGGTPATVPGSGVTGGSVPNAPTTPTPGKPGVPQLP